MQTMIIMAIIAVMFMIVVFFKSTSKGNNEIFFDAQDTAFLKGFWAIIIILVHIPTKYQNVIQDLVGSFAYIGVTFFFIASAFGLKHNIDNKKDYMQNFFSKRVLKIVIPMLFINICFIILNILIFKTHTFTINSFINAWVARLIFVYIIFWLLYGKIFRNSTKKADLYTSIIIILYSLLGCIPALSGIFRWNVEIVGVVLGILLYNNKNIVKTKAKYFLITLPLSIIIGLLYIKLKSIPFFGNYLLRILLSIILNYLSLQIINKWRFKNKINMYLGKISYEIYLCHPAIILIMKKLGIITNSGIFIAIVISLSILFAAISHAFTTWVFNKKNHGEEKKK